MKDHQFHQDWAADFFVFWGYFYAFIITDLVVERCQEMRGNDMKQKVPGWTQTGSSQLMRHQLSSQGHSVITDVLTGTRKIIFHN